MKSDPTSKNQNAIAEIEQRERERESYDEVDAGVIGAPEDVVIDDDEVTGDGVTFVEYVLVDAFDVGYSDGESREVLNEDEEQKCNHSINLRKLHSLSSLHFSKVSDCLYKSSEGGVNVKSEVFCEVKTWQSANLVLDKY